MTLETSRSSWWCSQRMTKQSSPAGSGRGRRGPSERKVQSRSTPSEAKPGSLWTFGPAPKSCCHTQGLPPATWLHQGITTLSSTSRYTFKPTSKMWGGMMWLVWHLYDLHLKSSFTHAFTVVCEMPKSLAICRIGRWRVSSMIAWTFSMNCLVRVFWQCPQPWASTPAPPKGRPIRWAVPSSVEPSRFAFWGCWQWSCCHNLYR